MGKGEPIFDRKNAIALIFALAIAAAAALLFRQFTFLQNIGYAEIFIVSLVSSATILLPMPGFALVFAAAPYLNPFLLGIAAGAGSGIGEISGYLAGFAGHNAVERTSIFRSHKKQIEKYGAASIFILALIPNPAFDMAGIAAGAIEMKWWKFLAATVAGKSIRYVLLAYTGSLAGSWL
jgi:membrane protein YqaA with SNARE-associated domain